MYSKFYRFHLITIVWPPDEAEVALDIGKAFSKSTLFSILGLIIFSFIGLMILGFGSDKYKKPAGAHKPETPTPAAT